MLVWLWVRGDGGGYQDQASVGCREHWTARKMVKVDRRTLRICVKSRDNTVRTPRVT